MFNIFKVLFIILSALLFSFSFVFAGIKKPPMRYTILFNDDIRHSDENFYSNRIDALFKNIFNIDSWEITAKAVPFVELRHSAERRRLERLSAGLEMGLDLTDFLYIGEQLRHVWRSEPVYNRGVIKKINMAEAVTIFTLSHQLIPGKKIIKGYATAEYTYDFRLGRGSRIESIAGLAVSLVKVSELNLGWRHRDRIHADDCDTFELSVSHYF